mgnify:CR=1 FL=1
MEYHQLLQSAIKAVLEASDEILKVYEGAIDVDLKDDKSPLTEADRRAHVAIENELKASGIPILSEEGKNIAFEERKNWEAFWLVDPLDGTKEFIKRNGEFTVNIALIEEGYPSMGIIFVPVTKSLYFGGSALDASYKVSDMMSGEFDVEELLKEADELPLMQSEKGLVKLVGSRSHMSSETLDFVEEIRETGREVELVSMGSSLKICLVAEGSADVYPRFAPTMEWDTGAGQAIAEGVGKEFIDWSSQERKTYNNENLLNNWFLVKGDYE